MGKKKNKFDLTTLVHDGYLKDGQKVAFVSDPSKAAIVKKQPNGEFKLEIKGEVLTVHAFAQKCLGTEPPDHAPRWLKTVDGPQANKTLYEIWHIEDDYGMAA